MKKLIFILLLFMPMIVYADVGMPEITEYEVVVTNVNGTTFYYWDEDDSEIIPYDTVLTVILSTLKMMRCFCILIIIIKTGIFIIRIQWRLKKKLI